MIPKIKKKSIKLNSNLSKTPKIIGLRAEAMVPVLLTALTPIPTTLVGKSSTMYTRNKINSVAIANLKKKMMTTSRMLWKQK